MGSRSTLSIDRERATRRNEELARTLPHDRGTQNRIRPVEHGESAATPGTSVATMGEKGWVVQGEPFGGRKQTRREKQKGNSCLPHFPYVDWRPRVGAVIGGVGLHSASTQYPFRIHSSSFYLLLFAASHRMLTTEHGIPVALERSGCCCPPCLFLHASPDSHWKRPLQAQSRLYAPSGHVNTASCCSTSDDHDHGHGHGHTTATIPSPRVRALADPRHDRHVEAH